MSLRALRFCAAIAVLALSGPAFGQQATGRAGPANPTAALFEAVAKNDIAGVRTSLAAGADIGARNEYGLTPADLAIKRGHYDIAHAILAARKAAPIEPLPDDPRRRAAAAPPAPPTPQAPSPAAQRPSPSAAAAPQVAAPDHPRVPAVPRIPVERQSLASVPPATLEPPPPAPEATPPPPALPATQGTAPAAPPPPSAERKEPPPSGFFSRVASLFGMGGRPEPRVTADVTPAAAAAPPPALPATQGTPPAPVTEAVPPPPPQAPAVEVPPQAPAAEAPPPMPAVEAPSAAPAKKSLKAPPAKKPVPVRAPAPRKPPAPEKKVTVTEALPAQAIAPARLATPMPAPVPAEAPKRADAPAPASAPAREAPPLHLSRVATIGGPVFAPAGVPPSQPVVSAAYDPAPQNQAAPPLASTSAPAPAPARATPSSPPPAPTLAATVPPPAPEPAPEPTMFGRLRGFLGFGEKDVQAKETKKPTAAAARAPETPRFQAVKPLENVNLGEGLSLKLGQMIATADAAPDHCLAKRGAKTWFCIEPAVWPADVQGILASGSALYRGSKAIVRYDDGQAGHIHALFPSRELPTLAAAFERRFGPPTEREDASMAIVGELHKTNPVVRWKSLNAASNATEIVELRSYDDLRGMIPDTEYGVIRYYRADAQAVVKHLTTADLMLLRSRRDSTE